MMSMNCRRGIQNCHPPDCNTHEVNIPNVGKVRGEKRVTMYHETYFAFEGIPYGYKAVDCLRFKAPWKAESWTHVKPCLKPGKAPAQIDEFTEDPFGDEDCLNLNIYVKDMKKLARYPVMVYIFGGGFNEGEAQRHQPDYFMFEDVVLVTINYRVGVFGFLSLKDFELEVPGNAGLKDIVLALKWIQKNCVYFNGDSRKVCLFGCSAGAGICHILSCSPNAKGLFQNVILQSGTMLCQWSYLPISTVPYRIALKFGYKGPNNERHILAYLRLLPAKALSNWHILSFSEFCQGILYPFAPTIEMYEMDHSIITEPYLKMIATAWGNNIPMMIGSTSFEGLYINRYRDFIHQNLQNKLDSLVTSFLLPPELQQLKPSQITKNKQKLIEVFFGRPDLINKSYLHYLDFASYRLFLHGIHRTILCRHQYATRATYQYRFDFDSPEFNLGRYSVASLDIKDGVCHSDDLYYLFRLEYSYKLPCDSPEYQTIRKMVSMWVSFAENSNPNYIFFKENGLTNQTLDIESYWKPLCLSNIYMAYNISYKNEFIRIPEELKLKVWDSLYNYNLF